MEREVVAHPAHLQPGGVALQVAAIGVIGIPFCHHAYGSVCAKICQFKAALRPAVQIFHDHDRGGVVGFLKAVGDFHPEHKIPFHLRVVIGGVAQGLREDALLTLVHAAAEEIRLSRRQNLNPVPGLFDGAFVQPFEFHIDCPPSVFFRSIITSDFWETKAQSP